MKQLGFFSGACVFLGLAAAPAVAADYFTHMYWDGSSGRVGYHMVTEQRIPRNDVPSPDCVPHFDTWDIQGDLPPGLTANITNARFEGTPRQPGDWDVIVFLHNQGCSNSGQSYGDRQMDLHFHIDP